MNDTETTKLLKQILEVLKQILDHVATISSGR
jgi:hypothetical protein